MKITQKGFSLIELMVVVAIIGILATMAVPQVNKFMARARQAEAKATLSGIYTSEKAFFTEYNTYQPYFQTVGYAPEGRVRYNAGFTGVSAPTCPAGLTCTGQVDIATYCGTASSPANGCSLLLEQASSATVLSGQSMTSSAFVAAAGAVLISGSTDMWTINQNKMLTQTQNGIP